MSARTNNINVGVVFPQTTQHLPMLEVLGLAHFRSSFAFFQKIGQIRDFVDNIM